ncbi:MAG TPA: glycosyltransferase family 4 protein [Bacteroidia bacterium]|nr:glycosyltransferase family 4 protein [Bacteroidia bacterium]
MSTVKLSVAVIDPVGAKAGLDEYNLSLLEELELLGCRVHLFSNFTSTKFQETETKLFEYREKQNLFSVFSLMQEYKKALRICRRVNSHYVIFHIFHFNFLDEWVLQQAHDSGFKIILIIHDVESFVFKTDHSRLQRICRQYAYKLVVHNEYTKAELLRCLEAGTRLEVHVIPHGNFSSLAKSKFSKEKARDQLNWDPDRKYILFFGMLKPAKGLDVLLQALPQISQEATLVIAGRLRKHSFEQYNAIIKSKNIRDRILLNLRHISNEERNLLFSASDVIALPYKRIYQSGVLLMAMSYGLPVVASALPAIKEVVRHGENGLLFETENPDDLALQLNRLFNDESLQSRLGEQARADSAKHHNWKGIAASFYSLFS